MRVNTVVCELYLNLKIEVLKEDDHFSGRFSEGFVSVSSVVFPMISGSNVQFAKRALA